jgi:hypothetical protein
MKQRSRDERLAQRGFEKDMPRVGMLDNFRGFTQDAIAERCGYLPCRFCGQPLVPYKDGGRYDISRCYSIGCPNNIDSPLRFDINESWRYPQNPDRIWANWMPKRLC